MDKFASQGGPGLAAGIFCLTKVLLDRSNMYCGTSGGIFGGSRKSRKSFIKIWEKATSYTIVRCAVVHGQVQSGTCTVYTQLSVDNL